jgi:ribosomal protein S27E
MGRREEVELEEALGAIANLDGEFLVCKCPYCKRSTYKPKESGSMVNVECMHCGLTSIFIVINAESNLLSDK